MKLLTSLKGLLFATVMQSSIDSPVAEIPRPPRSGKSAAIGAERSPGPVAEIPPPVSTGGPGKAGGIGPNRTRMDGESKEIA